MYPPEYQDLLDFIDSNPEYLHDMRVRLLSPDLIALPEQFAQLVGLVTELGNKLDAFAEVTDRRLTALEDHAVETIRRLNTLETDVGTIKTDVGTIKTQVAALNGDRAESRARQNILNIARDELNLTRGRILLARGRDTAPGLLESITAAEGNGLITRQQADNALYTDIIIRARRDRRQLVLPVATTIFAGRYGVIIRYGGTVDYRPTNQAIEAETYGRQDTGNGSGQGWDERAFSAQVAERPIAVAGETGASVAHSAGSLRRGVGG